MCMESLRFLKPSFSREMRRVTKPLTEKAGALGRTPLLSKCLMTVFSEIPKCAIAENTIQMDVDLSESTLCSN